MPLTPSRFFLNGFRQLESTWHKRHYSGAQFSETVQVFPNRSYGAHPQQIIDVFRPRRQTPAPLAVLVPGFYFCSLDIQSLRAHIKQLTHEGYAVALVHYRTAPEVLYPTQLKDISLAFRCLLQQVQRLNIEPTFFLQGFNSGANLVLNYLNGLQQHYLEEAFELNTSLQSNQINACVLSDGIYNLDSAPFHNSKWRPSISRLFLGDNDQHAMQTIASPAQHVTSSLLKTLPPLMITASPSSLLLSQFLELKGILSLTLRKANELKESGSAKQETIMQFKLTENHSPLAFFEEVRYQEKIMTLTQPIRHAVGK